MEHMEVAADVLQAFSVYTEKMERLPHVDDVLVLRLHADGSGHICASRSPNIVYLEFNDLADLLGQLLIKASTKEIIERFGITAPIVGEIE